MQLNSKKTIIVICVLLFAIIAANIVLFILYRKPNNNPSLGSLPSPSISPNLYQRITVASEARGYTLAIANRAELEKALDTYGFWNYNEWDIKQSKITELKVVYTDNPQPRDIIFESHKKTKTITASYSYTVEHGVLTVRVYVNPNLGMSKQTMNWYIEDYLLRLMYEHGLHLSQNEREFYNKFYSQQPYFFEINAL